MREVLVNCERLDHFGKGIGYVCGKIIFIPNLIPFEDALVNVVLDKKNYMVGEVVKILKKSDFRVQPKCGIKSCGCALEHLEYNKHLFFKREKVRDILKRYAGIDDVIYDIIGSDKVYGYRNKISLKVKDGKLGYFKNGTNDLLQINKCFLVSDKINEIIFVLGKIDLSGVSEVIIKDFGEVLIDIKGECDISLLKGLVDSIYMNGVKVFGKDMVLARLGDMQFYVARDAFFQVNSEVALKLYNKVLDYIGKGECAIDLYCGSGTISLFLSRNFKKVIGIEINKDAVMCANLNKELNGIYNVDFICADAGDMNFNLKADALVLDPPRSGLSKKLIYNILRVLPKKIVYVSCDPMTLARDLKIFGEKYEVKEVTLFDMFPLTYHVECVSLLCLKDNSKTLEK